MVDINNQATMSNHRVQANVKKWSDCKFAFKYKIIFKTKNFVLFSINDRFKDLKEGQIHWIGPYIIILKRPGPLFDHSYSVNNKEQIYYCVHPEFLKLYVVQLL